VARQIAESRRTLLPGRSRVDGTERFAGLVKVERYPLYAVVAVSAEAALAPYRQFRQKHIRWAVATTLGVLLAAFMLLRQARSLDESRRHTRTAEATFRAALEGSLDAVFILEAVRDPHDGRLVDLRIRDCNERAALGLSTSRADLLGATFSTHLPTSTERYLKAFEHVAATGKPAQNEMASQDPGLEGVWLHHQIVPLEDGFALISRDISEKKANEAALAALSRIDSLTSLSNRRGFEEKLEEAILRNARAKARDHGANLALLYVDLDGFKAINDSLGHAAGDAVLIEVARRLRAAVRTTDVVARLGGDEFAVIAENAGTPDDIDLLADRILGDLSKPHQLGEAQRFATPSIGIAVHAPAEHSGTLRSRADAAMYRAKSAGKARVVWENAATVD
jgi:diguanylate cyclase (GGDEF)-like protein